KYLVLLFFVSVLCALAYLIDELHKNFGEENKLFNTYQRINLGMSLKEVQALLGPGSEIPASEVPQSPDFSELDPDKRSKPVVNGDKYYIWIVKGKKVVIGTTDDKVCGKWYWEPSL